MTTMPLPRGHEGVDLSPGPITHLRLQISKLRCLLATEMRWHEAARMAADDAKHMQLAAMRGLGRALEEIDELKARVAKLEGARK